MEVDLSGPTDPRVDEKQLVALVRLSSLLPDGVYLAGGVAVALRFAHRESSDLDVFVAGPFDATKLAEDLSFGGPGIAITSVADRTVYAIVDGVPVSVLGYRYPLLRPAESYEGVSIPIASNEDLVAMKLSAIGNRGAAKDFWDLDVMLDAGVCEGRLDVALECFRRKFPSVDPGYVVRGLSYSSPISPASSPRGSSSRPGRVERGAFSLSHASSVGQTNIRNIRGHLHPGAHINRRTSARSPSLVLPDRTGRSTPPCRVIRIHFPRESTR